MRLIIPRCGGTLSAIFAVAGCTTIMPPDTSPRALRLASSNKTVEVSIPYRFAAAVLGADGTLLPDSRITWTTRDTLVATVDSTGVLTGKSPGMSYLVAASGDLRDSVHVVVVPTNVVEIELSDTAIVLTEYDTVVVTAIARDRLGRAMDTVVTWSNNNPPVATVDSTGRIIGLNTGDALVRAHVGGIGADVNVRVQRQFTMIATSNNANDSCALTTRGTVLCWGENGYGGVGDGSAGAVTLPTRILVGPAISIGAGTLHMCAIERAGTIACWGQNDGGQLGVPASGPSTCVFQSQPSSCSRTPVRFTPPVPLTSLSGGHDFTCGLTADSLAMCWGANGGGQLGDGTTTSRPYPSPVAGARKYVSLSAANNQVCGLIASGEVDCWGFVWWSGGGPTERRVPTRFATALRFRTMHVSDHHSCGITLAGETWCWGYNSIFGELGSGDTLQYSVPVRIPGQGNYVTVAPGVFHTCALDDASRIFCWGGGSLWGQAKQPTTPIVGTFKGLVSGGTRFCGQDLDGLWYCHGAYPGNGTTGSVMSLVRGQITQ